MFYKVTSYPYAAKEADTAFGRLCLSNVPQTMKKVVSVYAMKTHMGVEVQLHSFLVSTVHGGEWSLIP
jgi:hypothetical protein